MYSYDENRQETTRFYKRQNKKKIIIVFYENFVIISIMTQNYSIPLKMDLLCFGD